MGGVIITLTRGKGESTYRLSQTRHRFMCLGGLFGSSFEAHSYWHCECEALSHLTHH